MYYKTKKGHAVTWRTEGDTGISKKEYERLQLIENCEYLRELLGDEPYVKVTVTQVAPSGMVRHMLVETIVGKRIIDISSYVAEVLGYRKTKLSQVMVGGGGMDMTQHLRESLSMKLYASFKKIQGG